MAAVEYGCILGSLSTPSEDALARAFNLKTVVPMSLNLGLHPFQDGEAGLLLT